MPNTMTSSPVTPPGSAGVRIETGTIADVNPKNMTVGWVSQYGGGYQPAIQIMAPYLHYNNGDGFTCVPEVGAIAAVCFSSDEGGIPFVLGFLAAPEREGAQVSNLQNVITDPGIETDEVATPTANTTTAGGSTTTPTNPSDASYRAGRPVLMPGDMLWQGRDENFVILRRGGVLQIGSTQVCQRVYVPIRNFIRDFCENYELNTAAGSLSWIIQRKEDSPAPAQTKNELNLILREYAQDKKASIRLSFGSLDAAKTTKKVAGDLWCELVVAPGAVEAADGKVAGAAVFVLQIDKQGNVFAQAQDWKEEIKGNFDQKVTGNSTQDISGNMSVKTGGTMAEQFGGAHTMKGTSSDENWSGGKSITAATVKLGSAGAAHAVPFGDALLQWLATHTHTSAAPGSPTSPPVAPPTPSLLSTKVSVA